MSDYGLIVCDASPLITLAKAGELDVLLRQGIPVVIPDAVYHEATSGARSDGIAILDWVRDNRALVTIEQTETGLEQIAVLRAGLRARHMGETAAIETTDRFLAEHPERRAVLLYEDAGLRKREVDPRTDLVTTGAFLKALEQAGRIQSADRILDLAETGGRNMSRQREDTPVNEPPEALTAAIARSQAVRERSEAAERQPEAPDGQQAAPENGRPSGLSDHLRSLVEEANRQSANATPTRADEVLRQTQEQDRAPREPDRSRDRDEPRR